MSIFSLATTMWDLVLKLQSKVSSTLLKSDGASDSKSGVEQKEPSFDPFRARQHNWAGTGMF